MFDGMKTSPAVGRVWMVPILLWICLVAVGGADSLVWAQSVSGVRGFNGGVAPLVRFPGGNLYIDNQGTQGFLYTPGQNFETYSFRNPSTGQAWSGAVGTMGPQLSIGLIQGANQAGTPLVLPGPPRQTSPLAPIQSELLDPGPSSLLGDLP
jgi:hypothetical protein